MTKRKIIFIAVIAIAVVPIGCILWFWIAGLPWGFARNVSPQEANLRTQFVSAAEQWLGKNSHDDSHHAIVDLYNEHEPLAQNYVVTYEDKWCATFVSATAIVSGITEILPTECGCERQIELFRQIGCWEENDAYIPLPGDVIYYSAADNGIGDCTTWSDHVGIVAGTCGSFIKVIEGNFYGKVSYHYIKIDAATIRGYGLPNFASLINKTPMD